MSTRLDPTTIGTALHALDIFERRVVEREVDRYAPANWPRDAASLDRMRRAHVMDAAMLDQIARARDDLDRAFR
jgi:hypothetical protein